MTDVVIPLYDGFTALDVVGPYQVLAFTPGVRVRFVGEQVGPVVDDVRSLTLHTSARLSDVTDPDAVVVPGGPGTEQALNGPIPLWLKDVHEQTTWTTSVCSGALLLAAAGLLDGQDATSHYSVLDVLPMFGARPTQRRVVELPDQHVITAAGVSSGIDMALRLSELLTDRTSAQAVQLWVEYDPQPPFDSGSPAKASADVRERAAAYQQEARTRRTG
ncbi:DJ-1/PfpI family protein [Luteipulveratus halotolerans]|uniref:DJ-1/PfpI domain-containing protein n=1 Tax=Luteipulveratus halotolerans TaxID=1631356 RepID=A0A0L6CIA9_9MICO|nr:DJ-1/PfpI family protein [Luteipulveratus halotolerans]KNX37531.1 hypothetical protein VV01_10815 [Luteipulveratus halotolerans]